MSHYEHLHLFTCLPIQFIGNDLTIQLSSTSDSRHVESSWIIGHFNLILTINWPTELPSNLTSRRRRWNCVNFLCRTMVPDVGNNNRRWRNEYLVEHFYRLLLDTFHFFLSCGIVNILIGEKRHRCTRRYYPVCGGKWWRLARTVTKRWIDVLESSVRSTSTLYTYTYKSLLTGGLVYRHRWLSLATDRGGGGDGDV